jgi:hypothetical protein
MTGKNNKWTSFTCLPVSAVVALLATSLTAAFAVPRPLAANEGSAETPAQTPVADRGATQNANKRPDTPPPMSREPDIIIAKHVLLMDNAIVNWQELTTQFRVLRKRNGPILAHFHFTNGSDWNSWHDRIEGIYKEVFRGAGVSFGGLSQPASERYDAIRTEADLVPDPARARPGLAITPNGKPAVGAEVIVVAPKYIGGVILEGTKLRDPLDHQWVSTDAAGHFTAYPKQDNYRIVCLHASGVAMQSGSREGDELELHLQKWATVRFAPVNEAPDQSTNLTATPQQEGPDPLQFLIFSIRSQGKPLDVKVPAGTVVASRSLQLKDGTGIANAVGSFTLAPGAQTPVAIAPATDADRAAARAFHERLQGMRKGR